MNKFYLDKVSDEWTLENMKAYAEFIADCLRQDELYNSGYSTGEVTDYSFSDKDKLEFVQLQMKWGLEEVGYRQEWDELIDYDEEQFKLELEKIRKEIDEEVKK
jgi:hypothetical protein